MDVELLNRLRKQGWRLAIYDVGEPYGYSVELRYHACDECERNDARILLYAPTAYDLSLTIHQAALKAMEATDGQGRGSK